MKPPIEIDHPISAHNGRLPAEGLVGKVAAGQAAGNEAQLVVGPIDVHKLRIGNLAVLIEAVLRTSSNLVARGLRRWRTAATAFPSAGGIKGVRA